MKIQSDTMAAIATAPGDAGISIVRISGPDSLRIADAIFRSRHGRVSEQRATRLLYGHVRTAAGAPDAGDIDEVMLLVYRAPHSYTREDVVEIQGHGGRVSAQRILRAVLSAGARMAEAGEFTFRAFINGRIDLLQAEAVADLVRAETDRAAGAAVEQLEGGLSTAVNTLYDGLMSVASDLEATLDFPDDELPPSVTQDVLARLGEGLDRARRLLVTWEEGHLLREGARVVIAGAPNVGKSTLLNTLLGRDRAIVTPVAGTTRDTIEETWVVNGIPVRLTDTAGLRTTDSMVEQKGIERTRECLRTADIIIYMIEASQRVNHEEVKDISALSEKRVILVVNKVDLVSEHMPGPFPERPVIEMSLKSGQGVTDLKERIGAMLDAGRDAAPHATISERHRQILVEVLGEIEESVALLGSGRGDMVAVAGSQLRRALDGIGQLNGRSYTDELLDNVFTRFCIGK